MPRSFNVKSDIHEGDIRTKRIEFHRYGDWGGINFNTRLLEEVEGFFLILILRINYMGYHLETGIN